MWCCLEHHTACLFVTVQRSPNQPAIDSQISTTIQAVYDSLDKTSCTSSGRAPHPLDDDIHNQSADQGRILDAETADCPHGTKWQIPT